MTVKEVEELVDIDATLKGQPSGSLYLIASVVVLIAVLWVVRPSLLWCLKGRLKRGRQEEPNLQSAAVHHSHCSWFWNHRGNRTTDNDDIQLVNVTSNRNAEMNASDGQTLLVDDGQSTGTSTSAAIGRTPSGSVVTSNRNAEMNASDGQTLLVDDGQSTGTSTSAAIGRTTSGSVERSHPVTPRTKTGERITFGTLGRS